MSDIAQMEQLLRHDAGFVDYMSHRHREKEMARLEARLEALRKAMDALDSTPVTRITKKRYKSAAHWCQHNDWSDEDVIFFMQDYASRRKNTRIEATGVLAGLGRVGQAVLLG